MHKLALFGALIAASIAPSSAQDGARPENTSICDWYAARRFGSATAQNQLHLIQGIVSLAFGGAATIPQYDSSSSSYAENITSEQLQELTGILNEGVFDNTIIDLRPWFNGSKASTNLNGQAVGVNWLDGGGAQPLQAFLGGQTEDVEIEESANQWYVRPYS
jgi:hypothetical protein